MYDTFIQRFTLISLIQKKKKFCNIIAGSSKNHKPKSRGGKSSLRRVTTAHSNDYHAFDHLPQETIFEILSFLYDDISSIDTFLTVWWFSSSLSSLSTRTTTTTTMEEEENTTTHDKEKRSIRQQLKRSISNAILEEESSSPNSSSNSVFCQICFMPVCYPYRLMDKQCGHIVCGRCAWISQQSLQPCGCGIRIRCRPQRLDPTLANFRATWLLSEEENRRRLKHNDRRIHRESDGYFGKNGVPNPIDPFDRLSFMEDYDALARVDLSKQNTNDCITKILPPDVKKLYIVLCPSHENFKPYIVDSFDFIEDIHAAWPSFLQRKFFRSICKEDLVTLEEEDPYNYNAATPAIFDDEDGMTVATNSEKLNGRKRFEVRLVGWEHLADEFASYDF